MYSLSLGSRMVGAFFFLGLTHSVYFPLLYKQFPSEYAAMKPIHIRKITVVELVLFLRELEAVRGFPVVPSTSLTSPSVSPASLPHQQETSHPSLFYPISPVFISLFPLTIPFTSFPPSWTPHHPVPELAVFSFGCGQAT